jgi:tripeptidyl-peptidase-1
MVSGLQAPDIFKQIHVSSAKSSTNRSNSTSNADPLSCLAKQVDPPCLRSAYGLDKYGSASNETNAQAVIVNEGYHATDLATFCARWLLPIQKIAKDIGLNVGAGDEAALDTQYIIAAGQKVPTWWVWLDGHARNPFDNWLVWASNNTGIPFVHSLSVGVPENEFETDNPGGIERMNQEMMALGARGISIIFASGDSGYQINQKYGSSSPYVTSVGGVWNGDLGMDPLEVDPLTTGGFSAMPGNPTQPWQTDAIASFLNTLGMRPPKMATGNRCCPDLSIYDAGYQIIQNGQNNPIGGTSAAAPVLSGMISTINDQLLNAGKPVLGFLNYFLYQNEDYFEDIVVGNNAGYAAVKGYDPASGLGTFGGNTLDKLVAAALANWGIHRD